MNCLRSVFSRQVVMVVAYTVGRFQPPTIGHRAMIQKAVDVAAGGEVYVFVSSAKDLATNPLTVKQKLPILQHMFPAVRFVDTTECKPDPKAKEDTPCAGPLQALKWLQRRGKGDVTLVAGLDRQADFGPDAGIWEERVKPDHFEFLGAKPRTKTIDGKDDLNEVNMSGTKARTLVELGKKPEFYSAVGYPGEKDVPEVEVIYNTIREWIPESKQYLVELEEKRRVRAENAAKKAQAEQPPPKASKRKAPEPPAEQSPPKKTRNRKAAKNGGADEDEGDDDLRSPDAEYTPVYPAKGGTRRRRRIRKTRKNKASSRA